MRPLLILFAKAPIAGRVKTRLCPPLTHTEAADLHRALTTDTAELLMDFSPQADLELSTDIATDAWNNLPLKKSLQPEGNLGTRMFTALQQGLALGHTSVVILGGDSPGLPQPHISALLQSQADVTLGPTADGGYYAIACRAVNHKMFQGVRWSTEHALTDTEAAASASGLVVATAPAWFDIDVSGDLATLWQSPDTPPTRAAGWTATRICAKLKLT